MHAFCKACASCLLIGRRGFPLQVQGQKWHRARTGLPRRSQHPVLRYQRRRATATLCRNACSSQSMRPWDMYCMPHQAIPKQNKPPIAARPPRQELCAVTPENDGCLSLGRLPSAVTASAWTSASRGKGGAAWHPRKTYDKQKASTHSFARAHLHSRMWPICMHARAHLQDQSCSQVAFVHQLGVTRTPE